MIDTITNRRIEQLNQNVVATIVTSEGLIEIFFTADSGKVITREKIDTITKVFHPGIILGKDTFGRKWVAHNHYRNKKPTFELLNVFLDNKPMLWDTRSVDYNREEIVNRTIAEVMKGQTYLRLNYNCQTFVNLIVRDEHSSEAVDKIADGAMAFGAVTALFGMLFENKAMVQAGLSVAGIAGAGKLYSKYRR